MADEQKTTEPVLTEDTSPQASRPYSPDDVYIAVMGVTGAGKSTFISTCCKDTEGVIPEIGHGLQSMTQSVGVYSFLHKGKKVHLIDTPGFDDTYRSDSDVLKELAYWLSKSYNEGLKLSGLVYMHPITHNRMYGSAFKNLRTFKKLCGTQSMSSIVLATTMWSSVTREDGVRHEQELEGNPQYWGDMVKAGSIVLRHAGDYQSAISIVTHLMYNEPTVLEIQSEMVDQHKQLDATEAGREVEVELLRQREKFASQLKETEETLRAALEQQNRKEVEELLKEQEAFEKKLQEIQNDREELKISLETLIEQKEKVHREAMAALTSKLDESRSQNERQIRLLEEAQERARQAQDQDVKRRAEIEAELREAREKDAAEKRKMMDEMLTRIEQERLQAEQEKAKATDELRRAEAAKRQSELREQETALRANFENILLQQQMAATAERQRQQREQAEAARRQQAEQRQQQDAHRNLLSEVERLKLQQQQQQQQAQQQQYHQYQQYQQQQASRQQYNSYPVYQPYPVYRESSSTNSESLTQTFTALAGTALSVASILPTAAGGCTVM